MVDDKLSEAQHTGTCGSIYRSYSMPPFRVYLILGGVNWNFSYLIQTCPAITIAEYTNTRDNVQRLF